MTSGIKGGGGGGPADLGNPSPPSPWSNLSEAPKPIPPYPPMVISTLKYFRASQGVENILPFQHHSHFTFCLHLTCISFVWSRISCIVPFGSFQLLL